MAMIFMLLVAGAGPVIFRLSQNGFTALWGVMGLLMIIQWRKLPFLATIRYEIPFLAWLVCYLVWGVIVSTYPVGNYGIRTFVYFSLFFGTVLVCASRPSWLKQLATSLQWAVVLNLLVYLLLQARPGYASFFQDPELMKTGQNILNAERFAGLWGNANQAGFIALLVITLSVWAKPPMAWVGRVSGVIVVFLTASRQSNWILAVLLVLYATMVVARNPKGRAALVGVALLAAVLFAFTFQRSWFRGFESNPTVARILDFDESRTSARRESSDSRLSLAKKWMPKLIQGPWYGYGLAASTGDNRPDVMHLPGLPAIGTHNMYLGIWVEVGLLGLVTFLVLLGVQARKTFRVANAGLSPAMRWGLLSLLLLVVVDSFVKHTMLFEIEGWFAYSLLFILPTSQALKAMRQPPAPTEQ